MLGGRARGALTAAVLLSLLAGGAYEVLTSTALPEPCAAFSTGPVGAVGNVHPSEPPVRRSIGPAWAPGPASGLHPEVGTVPVVAAENFWGSLATQLGGNVTSVRSIVTDPNTDPHEYESSSADAQAVANARLVIVNGVGYDPWALSLIAAANSPGQIVLNAGVLNGVSASGGIVSGNPHLWYNPHYVDRTLSAMFSDLVSLAPGGRGTLERNYAALNASLAAAYQPADRIRTLDGGVEIASTESLIVYLANDTGLRLVSPPDFMQAVSEGNDPPAQSVVEFQCQLEGGQVRALVYNAQTETPLTLSMEHLAAGRGIPVVPFTETIQPANATFQDWIGSELLDLETALGPAPGGS